MKNGWTVSAKSGINFLQNPTTPMNEQSMSISVGTGKSAISPVSWIHGLIKPSSMIYPKNSIEGSINSDFCKLIKIPYVAKTLKNF